MRRTFVGLIGLSAAALIAGCGGGPKVVPVSGVVTVDGKPYKDAVVSFQPVGTKENPNPGRGSAGITDGQGRFTLVYDGTEPGALVGKHRVRIFTNFGAAIPDTEGEVQPLKKEQTKAKKFGRDSPEPIPAEWNEESTKEFDVPAGGTRDANFDIASAKGKN